jgi:hypothetical protein
MHVSETTAPDDTLPVRLARGPRVQKFLFKMDFTFDDGELVPVSDHTFRGASSGHAPCQRDKLRTFINWR